MSITSVQLASGLPHKEGYERNPQEQIQSQWYFNRQLMHAVTKHAKRNRLFSGSQKKSRRSKQLRWWFRRDESSEKEDESECFCTEYAEPYSISRAPTKSFQYTKCHKWAHDSCTGFCDFYVCRNCMSNIIIRIWCLNSDVVLVTWPFWDLFCFDKWQQSDLKLCLYSWSIIM